MMRCFHGLDPKACFFCGVIRAQALGHTRVPIQDVPLTERIWWKLRSWILFWAPKEGLTVEQVKKQEAQRVALADGLISKEEIDQERVDDLLGGGYELDQ